MLKFDKYNLVGQHRKSDPNYLDFGDCSNRQGLAAYFNVFAHAKDNITMLTREDGKCRRHVEYPWNVWNNFSRDQLLPYVLGLSALVDGHKYNKAIFWSHARRGFFCQNTYRNDGTGPKLPDFLAPDHIMHLIFSAKIYWLYWFAVIGFPFLFIQILWSTKVKPWSEQNQIISQLCMAGDFWLKLYVRLHPDYSLALMKYWNGWRDQPEFSRAMIYDIEKRIK